MPLSKSILQMVDRAALFGMNWRIAEDGVERFESPVTLEEVLSQTQIIADGDAFPQLTANGEHSVRLATRQGELLCHVTVRRAERADAPLFLYHHGIAEYPYTSSWGRLLPESMPFPAHTVAIQAPYHTNRSDPLGIGFSDVEHIYQMFAGSLRLMGCVQDQFQRQGAVYTVVGGVSWGGITSLLYEGLFKATRAVAPFYASPNLAQVIWDAAQMFGRPLPVSKAELDGLLDFTPIYDEIDGQRVFPALGEYDLFFRYENHAPIFDQNNLETLPLSHVGGIWLGRSDLRAHIFRMMSWAADNPG